MEVTCSNNTLAYQSTLLITGGKKVYDTESRSSKPDYFAGRQLQAKKVL